MTPRRRLSRGRFAVEELEPRFAPALTLGLLPGTVSEAAGASAATATVSRTGDLSAALTVALTSSDTSEATVPASITIPARRRRRSRWWPSTTLGWTARSPLP